MREQSKYRSFCILFYTKSISIDRKAFLAHNANPETRFSYNWNTDW